VADPRRQPKSKYTADRNMPGAFEGETVTRRAFMNLTAQGAGVAATMAFTLPALAFAVGSAVFERPPVHWQAIGRPIDFRDDNYLPVVITIVQGIGEVGKSTAYVRSRNPRIDGPFDPKEPFVALSSRCMHLGCPVRWTPAAQRFICPCHGGVYGFDGKVDGGPPVRPLDRFYTRVRNGLVELGPRYSVNSQLKRFPHPRDPAQPLDGIGQYAYPGRFTTPELGS
jgi:menaquinol-cytochrome c reductase iron-sulfur subunit